MWFLCLRGFPSWPYILRYGAGVLGQRVNKTEYSVASAAGRSIRTTRMWIVRDARNAELSMNRLSFEPNINFSN
jgi:hypothetical protein